MFTVLKIEIERNETVPETWAVYTSDDWDTDCETLAEAYLYAAKRFHELGMLELQDRINHLGDDASVS